MTLPIPYARDYSFTGYQAANPTGPLPGSKVDQQLDEISNCLAGVINGFGDAVAASTASGLAAETNARIIADNVLRAAIIKLGGTVGGGNNPGDGTDPGDTSDATLMSTTYLGQVATNCVVPTNANQYYTQFNSRSRHKVKETVKQLQFAFPNWNVATSPAGTNPPPSAGVGGIEHNNGLRALVRAAVEYPVGTFRPILFSGAFTGTIPAGQTLLSDVLEIDVPDETFVYVRTYWSSPDGGGLVWANDKDANNGEAFSYGVGGIPDKSRGGTITDGSIVNGSDDGSTNGFIYRPCAIVAPTRRRSICLFGDSRINNYTDSYANDSSASRGIYMASLADNFAYISTATGGDRAEYFAKYGQQRAALAQYCSHILIEYGINDVNQNVNTGPQIVALLQQIYQMMPTGKPIIQATYEPYTTSSDGWASFAGQTPAGNEAKRVNVNNAIRTGIGQSKTLDTADIFEDGRDSGRWKSGQIAGPLTSDGLHENYNGRMWMKSIGHIASSLFVPY